MVLNRRQLIRASCGGGLAVTLGRLGVVRLDQPELLNERLKTIEQTPILDLEELDAPVTLDAMELLRNGRQFVVRVRSTEGVEGFSVPNAIHFGQTYPIFLDRVAPFFANRDARKLESLLVDLYRYRSNYKYQGLPFWVCVAAAEFAILDLLGKVTGKSMGDLLGGVQRREIPVYRASGNRGNSPQEEIEYLESIVSEIGVRALKFRLGGRMGVAKDEPLGRSQELIPLVRETFGPNFTLYADANSSYEVNEAIKIGRLMEEHDYDLFEEPCRFDHLGDTKAVADALRIPIAGGEQEFSTYRFRWMIANRGVDIVQPDLHYHGGFLRSIRVARMANAAGMRCTPHMSGSGLGFLDAAHFVSCIPNPGPYTEYKGSPEIPVSSNTSSLHPEKGMILVPSGPGFGITIDPSFLNAATEVTTF